MSEEEKDKIEVGEYVRTKGGDIQKVLSIRKEYKFKTGSGHTSYTPERYMFDSFKSPYSLSKPYILKHSKNIIDLIEVGDYVNGELITKISKINNEKIIENDTCYMEEQDIKSVVTKEQFKEMEYKV